jgi:hypothetical protein
MSYQCSLKNGQLNCSDPFSIIVHTILYLGKSSTLEEIYDSVGLICDVDWTLEETEIYLNRAFKRGIVVSTSPTEFSVNARMVKVNPLNAPYYCFNNLMRC